MSLADNKTYGTPEYWAAVKADAAAWNAEEARKFYAAFDEALADVDNLARNARELREMCPRETWHQNQLSNLAAMLDRARAKLTVYFESD